MLPLAMAALTAAGLKDGREVAPRPVPGNSMSRPEASERVLGSAPQPEATKPRNPSSLRNTPVSVPASSQVPAPGLAGPTGVAPTIRMAAAEHMIAATLACTASAKGSR